MMNYFYYYYGTFKQSAAVSGERHRYYSLFPPHPLFSGSENPERIQTGGWEMPFFISNKTLSFSPDYPQIYGSIIIHVTD